MLVQVMQKSIISSCTNFTYPIPLALFYTSRITFIAPIPIDTGEETYSTFLSFITLSKILASSSCQPEFDVVPMILPLWYHLGIFMLQIRFYHLYKCWVEFIYEISFLNTLWIKITITITITITIRIFFVSSVNFVIVIHRVLVF